MREGARYPTLGLLSRVQRGVVSFSRIRKQAHVLLTTGLVEVWVEVKAPIGRFRTRRGSSMGLRDAPSADLVLPWADAIFEQGD